MAYPDKYERLYDYVSYQNTNPSRPLPAPKIHADLNSLATISDETVEFLKLFTRSDGALANGSVGYDQLSASLQTAGLAPAEVWATSTAYVVGDSVIVNFNLYRCAIAHTSGVFADDLAAGDWTLVSALPVNAYLAGTGLQLNTLTFSIDATVATLAGAQILTNKTISGGNNTISNLQTSMFASNVVDTDGTFAANSDTRLASQKATKTYVDGKFGTNIPAWLLTPSSANLRAAMTDETGTGALYFQGGDAGTPSALVGTNITGNATGFTAQTFNVGNAANLNSGTLPAARTNGHMNGTATNDNAAAGEVGEYSESVLLQASATALTSNTGKDVASITLGAGDWDISGAIGFIPAGTTSITVMHGSLSTTANTTDTTAGRYFQHIQAATVPGAVPHAYALPTYRVSLSGSSTFRLVALATFTVAGLSAFGIIRARRVR